MDEVRNVRLNLHTSKRRRRAAADINYLSLPRSSQLKVTSVLWMRIRFPWENEVSDHGNLATLLFDLPVTHFTLH